jgi:hypothetical protein
MFCLGFVLFLFFAVLLVMIQLKLFYFIFLFGFVVFVVFVSLDIAEEVILSNVSTVYSLQKFS